MKTSIKILLFLTLLIPASPLFSQTAGINEFERALKFQSFALVNPQLMCMKNPAALARYKHFGFAYYRGYAPAPEFNLLTGTFRIVSFGILFKDDVEKFYLGTGLGWHYLSAGLLFNRGFDDDDDESNDFQRFDIGFQSDMDGLIIAANFCDVDKDKHLRGYSALESGVATNLLWDKLWLGVDAVFSAGDSSFADVIKFAYHIEFSPADFISINAKYDEIDESVKFGADIGYSVFNFLTTDVFDNELERTQGGVWGIELSNRRYSRRYRTRKFGPYFDLFKNYEDANEFAAMLVETCPPELAFLAGRSYQSFGEIRNVVRERYYSRKLKTGELAQGTGSIDAGEGRIVTIHNIDPENYPEIELVISVVDSVGSFVPGLGFDDFSFADDTIIIVSVEEISAESNVPVDIVFVIDESGSMYDNISDLRKNIYGFVERLESSGIDFRLGLVTYGDKVNRVHRPTDDIDAFDFWLSRKLKGGVHEVAEDGILEACDMRLRQNCQKIFIIASDEEIIQGYSSYDRCDIIIRLLEQGISLYQVIDPFYCDAGEMSWLTFGRLFNIKGGFAEILDDLQKDITLRYILTYITVTEAVEFGIVQAVPDTALADSTVDITADTVAAAIVESVEVVPVEPDEIYVTVSGKVLDTENNPISAMIIWEDLSTREEIGRIQNADGSGSYVIEFDEMRNYGFYAQSDGFYPGSGNVNLSEITESMRIHQDIVLTPIEVIIEKKEEIRLNNIFFDFDKSDLKPESYPELDRLVDFMTSNPGIKIEIGGHTDWVGKESYNQSLSERRAQSVVNYLISQGIDSSQLIAVGYGELQPCDTNDTPEGRAMNRRVVFKVID